MNAIARGTGRPHGLWRPGALFIATVLALLLTVTITGCGSTGGSEPSTLNEPTNDPGDERRDDPGEPPDDPAPPPDDPTPPPDASSGSARLPLRGDPSFDPATLSSSQRARYDDIKDQVSRPRESHVDPYLMANSDDIWWYGHYLQTHVHTVLLVFRMTGDLELLDHVDELAQIMRSHLRDGWRGTKDGTDGTRDGYLNWVHRTVTTDGNHGKDLRLQYDMKAHATVAMIAYALHNNRDLTSPAGHDYGQHADFWRDYLINHFEAKVRSRERTTGGSFPIADWPPQNGAHADWTKWHYYMGLLTGDQAYTTEAERLSNILLNQLVPCSTPKGTAYVWRRSRTDHYAGHYGDYLMALGYAEFIYGAAIEFYLEGFHDWTDPTHLERMARGITQYVIDDPNPIKNGLARTVGGEQDRCGIKYSDSAHGGAFPRITAWRYARMLTAALAPWDSSNAIHSLTVDMNAYADRHHRDTTRLLAAMMLREHLR